MSFKAVLGANFNGCPLHSLRHSWNDLSSPMNEVVLLGWKAILYFGWGLGHSLVSHISNTLSMEEHFIVLFTASEDCSRIQIRRSVGRDFA